MSERLRRCRIEKAVQLIRRLNATVLYTREQDHGNRTEQLQIVLRSPREERSAHRARRDPLLGERSGHGRPVAAERQDARQARYSLGRTCMHHDAGHPKCPQSRNILQRLLSRFDDQGKCSMPSEAWIGRILKGLGSLVGGSFPRGKDLIRILTKRCSLDSDVAQRVAACIDSDPS